MMENAEFIKLFEVNIFDNNYLLNSFTVLGKLTKYDDIKYKIVAIGWKTSNYYF